MALLNALGVARDDEHQACFYGALGNIPAEERYNHEYLAILAMLDEKVLKKLDPVRVIAGADPITGEFIPEDWASPGAQFRAGEFGLLTRVRRHKQCAMVHTMAHVCHGAWVQWIMFGMACVWDGV